MEWGRGLLVRVRLLLFRLEHCSFSSETLLFLWCMEFGFGAWFHGVLFWMNGWIALHYHGDGPLWAGLLDYTYPNELLVAVI